MISGKTIALCLIVKDEAAAIERCLLSARPLIDTWVICDTGSTDGTPELIEKALAGIPGQLHHRPWRDFGHNRTEMLALARGAADYLLLLDADDTLRVVGELPELTEPAYLIVRRFGTLDISVPWLLRGDRSWRYNRAVHEYLVLGDLLQGRDIETFERVTGLAVVHDSGDPEHRIGKLRRNLELLHRDNLRLPDDHRTTFYLGQTYRELGDRDAAIFWYRRRLELEGGWEEETFYARFILGVILAERDWMTGATELMDAWERRPNRAEPLHELARISRKLKRYQQSALFAKRGMEIPYTTDILFVHRDMYEWGLLFEYAISAWWIGEYEAALEANDKLLAMGKLPPRPEADVRRNRKLCIREIERRKVSRQA